MLTAYFDDSGAHSGASVSLLAGLFGNAHQWDHFNGLWKQALEAPLNGARPQVRRFHMFDCYGSRNEFKGWTRTEADDFGQQLANIMLKCGIWGCATAVTARDKPAGDLPGAAADAEGAAMRYSLHLMRDWAGKHAPHDREMAVVLDDRPERKTEYQAVFGAFSEQAQSAATVPLRTSLTFANAASVLPLQAADLFAWEVYQDELSFLHRERPAGKFDRKLLARMAASGRFRIQSATTATIGSLTESFEEVARKSA